MSPGFPAFSAAFFRVTAEKAGKPGDEAKIGIQLGYVDALKHGINIQQSIVVVS